MHPTISYDVAHARIAGLRDQAQRDAAAREAGRARSGKRERTVAGWQPLGRWVRRQRRPSPRAVLAIASVGAAVAFIDATIVNIAFPDIARSFPGTSISSLSWVLNAYNIVFAAFLMAAAGIADRLGRRRVFVFGLQLFTVGSLLCAIAPSAGALIAFRVVQGLGAALLVPSALALVLHAYRPARRSHAVALLSAVSAAAAGLGPSLGGLLVTAANWRLVFLVNIPIGVAVALLAPRRLAESRAPGRRRIPDLPGTLLFALATGTLVLGMAKGQEWHWDSARVTGCLAAALVLGAVVVWRCRRHRSPVFDLSLLTGVWRYPILQAGLALSVGPVVAVVVAGPASRLVQRIGPRPVLVAGGLLWGGAVMWFVARVGTTPDFTGAWLPGMSQGAVSHSSLVLLFTNSSGAACVVQGYPGVAAQLPGGRVYNAVRAMAGYMGGDAAPSPPQAQLAPGRTASAVIEWLIAPRDGSASVTPADCAGDGAVGLLVTIPDQTTSTRLASPDQHSPICWGFEVHPIVAGSTGQYPTTN